MAESATETETVSFDSAIWLALEEGQWENVAKAGATIMDTKESLDKFNANFKESKKNGPNKEGSKESQTTEAPKVKSSLTSTERTHYAEVGKAMAAGAAEITLKLLSVRDFWKKMKDAAAKPFIKAKNFLANTASKIYDKGGSIFKRIIKWMLMFAAIFALLYITFKGWFDKTFPNMWKKLGGLVTTVVETVMEWLGQIGTWIAQLIAGGLATLTNWIGDSGIGDAVSEFLQSGPLVKFVGEMLLSIIKNAWKFLFGDSAEDNKPVQPPRPDKGKVEQQKIQASLDRNKAKVSMEQHAQKLDYEKYDQLRQYIEQETRKEADAGKTDWAKTLSDLNKNSKEYQEQIQQKINADMGKAQSRQAALVAMDQKYDKTVQEVDDLIKQLYGSNATMMQELIGLPLVDKITYLRDHNADELTKLQKSLAEASDKLTLDFAETISKTKKEGAKVQKELAAQADATVKEAANQYVQSLDETSKVYEIDKLETFNAANELSQAVDEMLADVSGNGVGTFMNVLADTIMDVLEGTLLSLTNIVDQKTIPLNVSIPSAKVTNSQNTTSSETTNNQTTSVQQFELTKTNGMTNILQVSTIDKSSIENTIKDINEKEALIVKELINQEVLLAEVNTFLTNVSRGAYADNITLIRSYQEGEKKREEDSKKSKEQTEKREKEKREQEQREASKTTTVEVESKTSTTTTVEVEAKSSEKAKDGAPGKDGERGERGEAGRDGERGKDGETEESMPRVIINTIKEFIGGTSRLMPTTGHRPINAIASQTETFKPVGQ